MTRLPVVVALVAAGAVLTGCGSGGSAGSTGSAASPDAAAATTSGAGRAATSAARTPDIFDSMTSTPSPDGDITMAQVRAHADAASCWTTIDGGVYDLTRWIPVHYGGPKAIESLCGVDGTARFKRQHATFAKAVQRLETYRIGTLKG